MRNYNSVINAATAQALSSRFDANETAFLTREMEQVRAKVINIDYPDFNARKYIPIATDIAESVEVYVYFSRDRIGKAKIIANGVDDLPRIDVSAAERTGKVRQLGDSYGWTINEMAESVRLQKDLPMQKVTAAREAIEQAIDEVLCTGTTTHPDQVGKDFGITGLLNNADVVAQGIINPANDPWSVTPTAAEMIADLNTMMNTIVNANTQKYIPDTILFAPAQFSLLASTPYGIESDSTVLTWFLKNNPFIKNIDQWFRLTGAGAGGTTDRAIIFKRDPSVLEGVIPQEFRSEPPQARNLEFVVPCHARCGGVKVYKPAAIRYVDFQP
jgi:hypothetical protein